jgi:phytoene dehydrogenase-like protein
VSSRSDTDHADVIVVGAGLAGLAAARVVHAAGRSVLVLEASDGVGGRVRTDLLDGFQLDRGFQVLLTAYPEVHRQLDVAALRLQTFDPGALVWRRGRGHVVADPLRMPRAALSTALAPIGSPLDKLRILRQRQRLLRGHAAMLLRGPDVSTIGALRAARFSDATIDRFLRPLFAGIQLDPSLRTSARMYDIIFRSLATGDSAVPRDGMGAIPLQMASHLPAGAVRLHSAVEAIDGTTAVLTGGRRYTAGALVVATEGPVASRLLGLPAVGSKPVGCVYFSAERPPTAHKLVVLDGECSGPACNVAVISNVAPSYAPAGRHLIAAALPGVTGPDVEPAARAQLRGWWGAQVDHWQHLRSYSIAHGQPDQSPPLSPKQRVDLGGGLFVCGDHRDTGSIQGAMYSGRRCGEAVVAALG